MSTRRMNRDGKITSCCYSIDTPDSIVNWLERIMSTDRRVRLFYGDTERLDFELVHGRKPDPGKCWDDEYMVTGTIGKSTGLKPIPLLLANARSNGGGGILDGCIVRLFVQSRHGWQEAYRHPNFHSELDSATITKSELAPEYSHAVVTKDGEFARFHSEKSAMRWLAFMRGERMSK